MALDSTLDSLSLADQVVLLSVASVQQAGETPIQTHELRRICMDHAEEVDAEIVGTLSEADVMRSLYTLEDHGIVEEVETEKRSPTGKGRPTYALEVNPDAIYETVDDELAAELEELKQ